MSSFFFFCKKLHCTTVVAISDLGRKMLKLVKKIFSLDQNDERAK